MPLEKSAGAVIFSIAKRPARKFHSGELRPAQPSRREYLLLHYESGHWDFPKGHLEGEETTEVAARREIFEETGLRAIRIVPGFQEHIKYWLWPYNFGQQRHSRMPSPQHRILKIVTFFVAHAKSRGVKLSWEHTGYAWLPYKDAVKLVTYENAKEILRKAENFLKDADQRGLLRR